MTIQFQIVKKRTAKCIIIKVNYTIQDAFKRRQVYMTKKKAKREYEYDSKKINDKLISRRTKRNLFTHSLFQYTDIDLN